MTLPPSLTREAVVEWLAYTVGRDSWSGAADAVLALLAAVTSERDEAVGLLREARTMFASGGVCDECRVSERIDSYLSRVGGAKE